MSDMLKAAAFDMVFVQFYKMQQCSARRWACANSKCVPGGSFNATRFAFDAWVSFLASTEYNKKRADILGSA
jgi:hypothetical protein